MKKLLCLWMITAVILTGCGKGGTATSSEGSLQRIEFPCIWVGKDSKAASIDALVQQFNKENEGKIQVVIEEIADYDAYEDKMRTNLGANQVPDLFTFKHNANTEKYLASGKLMDFKPYLDEGWGDDFLQDALDEMVYEEKIMAIPYEFGVTPVMYNRAMLEEVGYESFPTTYEAFFKLCEELKAKGHIATSQMTANNAWTSMLWYSQLVHSIGGADVYEGSLGDPAFVEAATYIKKMYDYTTEDAVGASAAVAAGHFLNGRTAMLMNGPWFIGRIKSEGGDAFYDNISIAPAPYVKGGKGAEGGYVGFIQANFGAAKQKDKAKEEAVVKFVKYLTNPANVREISKESGAMFVIKYEPSPESDRLQSEMIQQVGEAPYVIPHFNAMVPAEVAAEFPHALSSLVLGEMTPEEFGSRLEEVASMYK